MVTLAVAESLTAGAVQAAIGRQRAAELMFTAEWIDAARALELGLAALARFLWVQVEPGIVRDLALNVMLIGGISTLVFNGNPLLRFDGYYMFADAIDVPNLGSRSNKYIAYLAQRYLCGVRSARSPANAPGEARWFFFYGIAAFIYRQFIMVAIIMLIALKAFALAVVLGASFLSKFRQASSKSRPSRSSNTRVWFSWSATRSS